MSFAFLRARRAREQKLVLGFLAVSALIWGFVQLADETLDGETTTFDRAIMLHFRIPENPAVPIGPQWLKQSVIDLTALGSMTVLAVVSIMAVALLLLRRRYRLGALMAAATGGGFVLGASLKELFSRQRPDIVPHLVEVNSLSFPSGHATNSAIVYLTIALVLARNYQDMASRLFILLGAVVLVIGVGLTRVFLGVHYPTDVLAGWMIGAAWALAMGAITRHLQRQRKIEQPTGKRSAPSGAGAED